jgi:WD40 repeat protein
MKLINKDLVMHRSIRLSQILMSLLLLVLILPAKADFEQLFEEADTSVETCSEEHLTSAVFSSDGDRIITASRDGTVRFWNQDMTQLMSSYSDGRGVWAVVSASQNYNVVIVSDRGDLTNRTTRTVLLDDTTGEVFQTLQGSYGATLGTDVMLTNGSSIPGVRAHLWDIKTGQVVRELDRVFYDPIISPDGQLVITTSDISADYSKLWTFPEAELAFTFPDVDPITEDVSSPTFNYYRIGAFSSDGEVIALVHGTSIFLWNRADLSLERILDNIQPVSTLVFSNSGQFLLVGGKAMNGIGGQAVLWDLKTGEIAHEFNGFNEERNILSVAFSPDDHRVLIVHHDRIRVLDVKTGELISEHSGCLSDI